MGDKPNAPPIASLPSPLSPMSTITLRPRRELLKRTTTRCPVCRLAVPGEVWREGIRPARVILRRTCPTHGPAEAVLATDARFYWLAQGDPENANSNGTNGGCCVGRWGGRTHTCGRDRCRYELYGGYSGRRDVGIGARTRGLSFGDHGRAEQCCDRHDCRHCPWLARHLTITHETLT